MSRALIRPAAPADAEALSLAANACFLETFADVLAGPDLVAHCRNRNSPEVFAAWLADPTARVWVAADESTGTIVGYVTLAASDLIFEGAADETLEVKRIYLLGRYHGTGAGSAMMRLAVEEAKSRGVSLLALGVYGENHRATAFYRRHGFETVGTRRFRVGSLECDDLIMAMSFQ